MKRLALLALILCGCADFTAPTPVVPIAPAIVYRSTCADISVWEFYLDGTRLGLYAFPAESQLVFPVARGAHVIGRTEWKPTISEALDSIMVSDTTRIALGC